jgi:hypothetical protein
MTIQVSLVSIHLYLYILIFYETHFSLVLNIILYPFFTCTFESEQSEYKFVRKGSPLIALPRIQYIMLLVIEGILIFLSNWKLEILSSKKVR